MAHEPPAMISANANQATHLPANGCTKIVVNVSDLCHDSKNIILRANALKDRVSLSVRLNVNDPKPCKAPFSHPPKL